MDPIGSRLMAANFRGSGFDAMVVPESAETLALGLKHTLGGECVPCPTTAGAFLAALKRDGIPAANAAFFMPTACGPCRFGQYATLDRLILDRQGQGDVLILSPSSVNAYQGLPEDLRRQMWDCFLLADILHKVEMANRPFETEAGAVDREVDRTVRLLEREFERGGRNLPAVLREALPRIAALKGPVTPRPRVGVVGEIYVRSDPFINGELVRTIERLGGQAHQSSLAEWVMYTDYLKRLGIGPDRRKISERLTAPIRERFLSAKEELYYRVAEPFLDGRKEPPVEKVTETGLPYVPLEFQGEAILTIGRAILMVKEEGCEMVVNASPSFCMPGTVTTAIFPRVERELGAPVVSIFYDGSGDPNRVLVPHLHYLTERSLRRAAEDGKSLPSSLPGGGNRP